MKSLYLIFVLGLLAAACVEIENASPADRATFIRFFEKNRNYTGVTAELSGDGFIIAGNTQLDTAYSAVITKVNHLGNTEWEVTIPNASVNALKPVADGYLILGDSIQVDRNAENVNDQIVTKARLIKMSSTGTIGSAISIFSESDPKTDFHGSALTFDAAGNIITIGSFKSGTSPGRAFVVAHNPSDLSIEWMQSYSLLDRDYINSKSAYMSAAGKVFWASSALKEQQSSSLSYLLIPLVEPNSTFINGSMFGENADQYCTASDLQPTSAGYGIIGSYSNIQKTGSNILFVRTDILGNVVPGSARYYDGQGIITDNISVNAGESVTEDTGSALAPTSDGGFLLGGSLLTNTDVGNGGTDIFLIRIDAFGNVIWTKNIGGAGDETVSSIRTTADGGFLICGSSSINGLSSAFIMKTDKNGEIKN